MNPLYHRGCCYFQGLRISEERIEGLGFSSASMASQPSNATRTLPPSIGILLRILPSVSERKQKYQSFSSHGRRHQSFSIHENRNSGSVMPELSSYQVAVELQRQLGQPQFPTAKKMKQSPLSPLQNPSIVGEDFAQLSRKMFIG